MRSKISVISRRWPGCLILILGSFFHLAAQQPSPNQNKQTTVKEPTAVRARPAVADESETSFDVMIGADKYLVYGEVRNVGQQTSAPEIANLLASMQKMDLLPTESKPLLTFISSHAEALANTRLIMAAMRAEDDSKLPQVMLALEFSATPDAQKFEPQLQKFLRAASLFSSASKNYHASQLPQTQGAAFVLQRKANVILLADTPFDLKTLKTAHSRALAEEPHFLSIRSRLAGEPVFIYVNSGEITRSLRKQMEKAAERQREMKAKEAEKQEDNGKTNAISSSRTVEVAGGTLHEEHLELQANVQPQTTPDATATQEQQGTQPEQNNEQKSAGVLSAEGSSGAAQGLMSMLLGNFMGGGFTQWPEGAGAALAFENDSLVIRSLITTESGENVNPVPMLPFLRSGPPIALEAPALVPDNAELMISASLNLPRMFDSFLQLSNERQGNLYPASDDNSRRGPDAEIEAMEKKYGFSLRNDLLPVIGNEIAVTIPMKEMFGSLRGAQNEKSDSPSTGFLVFISLRDKSAAQALLPRVMEAFGMKGAEQMLAKETRGDVEIMTTPMATLAFINNFLVVGQTAPEVYRAVDAYNQHQTLASSGRYAEAVGWQPSQKLAQFYLSEQMMKSVIGQTQKSLARSTDSTRNAFAGFNPEPKPVTFAVTADGVGILHELHLPKTLITTMIAGAAADNNKLPYAKNEDEVAGRMQSIYYYQMQYYNSDGKNVYATIDQLNKMEAALPASYWKEIGYRLEINAMGDKFTATATPVEYGATGKISYYIDETGILRGADHSGNHATIEDQVISRY